MVVGAIVGVMSLTSTKSVQVRACLEVDQRNTFINVALRPVHIQMAEYNMKIDKKMIAKKFTVLPRRSRSLAIHTGTTTSSRYSGLHAETGCMSASREGDSSKK